MNKWVSIPVPPSANKAWRNGANGRGRFRTSVYLEWLSDCAGVGYEIGKAPVPCWVHIHVTGGKGWPASRDLDNVIKIIQDMLTGEGVLIGDNVSHVTGGSQRYSKPLNATDTVQTYVCITEPGWFPPLPTEAKPIPATTDDDVPWISTDAEAMERYHRDMAERLRLASEQMVQAYRRKSGQLELKGNE